MDGKYILVQVARALREQGLEAVLIERTTFDLDFLILKTPANVTRLKGLARQLGAVAFRQSYPTSGDFRLMRDNDGLQLDFMTTRSARSFKSVRSRAIAVKFGGETLYVARNAVRKLAADRDPDRPANTSKPRPIRMTPRRKEIHQALLKESELDLQDQIRRLLAKPPGERTHFLRRKIGIAGSCL